MKASFNALIFVSLACLQHLSGAQAQTTTGATGGSTAGTSTTSAAVVAPTQPAFINTPGLQVTTPFDGMAVVQNTVLSISASLQDQQPISSINISVAKKDGSSNTTIINILSGATLRLTQIWNVTADKYPVGDYLFNMIVTPNTTAAGSGVPAASSTILATPTGGATIPNGATIYYWHAGIRVIAPVPTKVPNAAISIMNSNGVMAMVLTATAAVLGSFLPL